MAAQLKVETTFFTITINIPWVINNVCLVHDKI